MPTALLNSQIATLEPPGNDENVLIVDVGRRSTDEAEEIITWLQLITQTRSPARGNTSVDPVLANGASQLRY